MTEYEEQLKRKDKQIEELKEKNETLLNTIVKQEKEISELHDVMKKIKNKMDI